MVRDLHKAGEAALIVRSKGSDGEVAQASKG
jgi:hypothetical protein